MWKRSVLAPEHVVRDRCDANAAVGWILVDQPYPSGHMNPLFHPGCRCRQELMEGLERPR